MDVHQDNSAADPHVGASLAQALADHCAQAQQVIAAERENAEQIEAELLEQLDALSGQLARQEHAAVDTTELETQLQQRLEALDAREQAVNEAENQIADSRAEVEERERALATAEAELADQRTELEARSEDLKKQEENLQSDLHRVAEREAHLEDEAAATKRQRRRIARELKDRRAEALDEIKQQQEKLERDRQASSSSEQSAIDELNQAREALIKERDQLLADLEKPSGDGDTAELQAELDDTRTQLADLQRRNDMAIADLKEANHRCTELEEQLAEAAAGSEESADPDFNWEQQKNMLMASMDSSGAVAGEAMAEPAATGEDGAGVRQVIAAKDQEIQRLNELLAEKESAPPAEPDGKEPIASVTDADEVVQQEREKLKAMQEELRNKQREAEVEISLQRAKLAREKVDIEDKLAHLEQQKKAMGVDTDGDENGKKRKKGSSRWMSRLGLADSDD